MQICMEALSKQLDRAQMITHRCPHNGCISILKPKTQKSQSVRTVALQTSLVRFTCAPPKLIKTETIPSNPFEAAICSAVVPS